MGHTVIVAYRPKDGKAEELLELTREHHPVLAGEKLVTKRAPYLMRSSDGTIVEVFEWISKHAMDDAHTNSAVLAIWERFADVCEYVTLPQLPESAELFAGFASLT